MTEIHREERRRTWWLLFLMDRHLALCYNRPLALLEAECQDLLLPLDDITWQSGVQPHSHGTRAHGPRCMLQPAGTGRAHGPPSTCTGPGLFEFFLPLMTITGHLLDFNRAKNHHVKFSVNLTTTKAVSTISATSLLKPPRPTPIYLVRPTGQPLQIRLLTIVKRFTSPKPSRVTHAM